MRDNESPGRPYSSMPRYDGSQATSSARMQSSFSNQSPRSHERMGGPHGVRFDGLLVEAASAVSPNRELAVHSAKQAFVHLSPVDAGGKRIFSSLEPRTPPTPRESPLRSTGGEDEGSAPAKSRSGARNPVSKIHSMARKIQLKQPTGQEQLRDGVAVLSQGRSPARTNTLDPGPASIQSSHAGSSLIAARLSLRSRTDLQRKSSKESLHFEATHPEPRPAGTRPAVTRTPTSPKSVSPNPLSYALPPGANRGQTTFVTLTLLMKMHTSA
jgi:hypothetical protein